jgi:eukaryotic-like serine/threonine-protein kinase
MNLAEQQIAAGQSIGPYVVSRRLGAGGMGEVYLARHRHLDRDAAVKVLLPEISMNQNVVSRFFTEARATAQLRHPNIVEIVDCDVLPDGRAYIVMEYLRGESLRQTLDRVGQLAPNWTSIAAIVGLVADALQAAHASGIVHRDLKPDNTYLTSQHNQRVGLTVKVLDFGIAKLLSDGGRDGNAATRTGSLIGTPLYMSPEQCRGIPDIDHRADVYSLGCMLFEMVAGQPPFVADAPGDILLAHMLREAPRLVTLNSSVPAEICEMVAQMLAKDPGKRPQSMTEVVAACAAFLCTPKNQFASLLSPPPGFPEQAGQVATQVLAADSAPPHHVPPLQYPPPLPRRSAPAARSESTELDSAAHTPSRMQRTPAARIRRGTASEAERDESFGVPTPIISWDWPKWLLPIAIIVAIVVLGILVSYFLTRPKPTPPPVAEPERPAKPEPADEPEPPVQPTGFVPPDPLPSPNEGAAAQEPTRPRKLLPATEPDRTVARKVPKKKSATSKRAEPSAGGEFKAVGD